ncbi:MAG: hypothetical protein DLM53_07825 [Candidatus Eremiobacter antarcticus]|nr:MAG: hypothetical protein DLM53_07825 [Candidatus Eremiobacter sp. RRmetagenome_bin22]
MDRGAPQAIRCDNGAEFTAIPFDQWAYCNQITVEFSRPGKPTGNGFIEAFNGSPVDGQQNARASAKAPCSKSHCVCF